MTKIVILCLLLLSGMCAYASINHLFVALRRPLERTHLLFAIMCLIMVTFTLSHALVLQAANTSEFILALRWNLAVPFLFFHFFLWFIALYTGKRLLPLIVGLNTLFVVLFVANLTLPYTIQYDRFDGIRVLYLPWGEAVTLGVGHNGLWAHIAIAGVLMTFGYALYALGGLYRRDRQRTSLCMMLAIGLFMVSSIQGILVRLSVIDFIHLGPFGFLTVVLVMSATLTYETRQRLRNSERRFRSLVEQSPFSIQMLAPDGRTRQVNPAWEKLWGVKSDVLAGYNILHDQQLIDKGVMSYVENGFAGKAAEIPPIVYNPADNPVVRGPVRDRWVRAYIYPIKDADRTVREVILMHEDITEKKRVEDAIRLIAAGVSTKTGERFFQQMVESLTKLFGADYAFIGMIDETQWVNTLVICVHGKISPNMSYSLAGTPCANVINQSTCAYPRDVQQLFPEDRLLAEMDVEGYIGAPLFDAEGKPLGIIVVMDTKPLEHIEQVKEILEIFAARTSAELARLRAEEALKESEGKFRSLSEKSLVGVYLIQDGIFGYVNPKLAEMFGYTVEELIEKKGPKDFVLPEDWPIVEGNLIKRVSGEVESIHYDFRGVKKDKETISVEVYGSRTMYKGRPAVIGTLLDITERKRADEERAFLANITEHATDAIEGIDLDTNIASWNRGAEILFGYHTEEVIGKPHSLIVPKEAQEACRERFKKATLEGFVRAETERIKKDAKRFPVEVTLTALRDEKGEHIGFVCITRDITERRKLEEQLRHAQKMEAIGQLAGGIAHDFNNILSAITGFGSLIEMNMNEDDPNKAHLNEMLKAGERAAQLTKSLLAFSRKQIIDLKPQNLNEIIKDVEKFLRRIIGEDIKLKTRASAKNLTILADRGQIEQVLMNLATNARDAMPEGGELTIETAIIQIDKEYIKNHNYGEPGMYALLSVTDSGMGMDEKTRQKIFEPFFTTKEMGRGTGLGLAMIYGIVKQHDGYIDVYSVPEKGTTFRIYMPLINLEAKEKVTVASTVYLKGGAETVLVAEDDEAVRKITNDMLERFGYKFITAVDGEDAIKKFKENKDDIKLLLLDVIMPKKNGKEAYEEIRKIKPDIKTIFLSGYMADLMDKKGILKEGLNFVMKPASPKELLRKVREVLDSPHLSAL